MLYFLTILIFIWLHIIRPIDAAYGYGGLQQNGLNWQQNQQWPPAAPKWPPSQQSNPPAAPQYPAYRPPIWVPPPPPPAYSPCHAYVKYPCSQSTMMTTAINPTTELSPTTTDEPITAPSQTTLAATSTKMTDPISSSTILTTPIPTTTFSTKTTTIMPSTSITQMTSTIGATSTVENPTTPVCVAQPPNSSFIILEDADNATSYQRNGGLFLGSCPFCLPGITKEYYRSQAVANPIYPQALWINCGQNFNGDYSNVCICAEDGECFRQQNTIRLIEVQSYCDAGGCHMYIEFFNGQSSMIGDRGTIFTGSASNGAKGNLGSNVTAYIKAAAASCKGCDNIRLAVVCE